jgi:hypothetical protein
MALTEATLQDKIEIVGDYKHVQVRTADLHTVVSAIHYDVPSKTNGSLPLPLPSLTTNKTSIR